MDNGVVRTHKYAFRIAPRDDCATLAAVLAGKADRVAKKTSFALRP